MSSGGRRSDEVRWLVLVTFERRDEPQDILPEWAQGACGWMLAVAPDDIVARALIRRDVMHRGLQIVEMTDERAVCSDEEIEEIDGHLAINSRVIEPGKLTVWGTIHCYVGDGEA